MSDVTVSAGDAAELAAERKITKYSDLSAGYCFNLIAFETLDPINKEGVDLASQLGKRLSSVTGGKREASFLRQRLSICLQRYNAVCVKGTFANLDLLNSNSSGNG